MCTLRDVAAVTNLVARPLVAAEWVCRLSGESLWATSLVTSIYGRFVKHATRLVQEKARPFVEGLTTRWQGLGT